MRHTFSLLSAVCLSLFALSWTGCDSGGDSESDVTGIWESHDDDVVFASISTSAITIYDFMGDDFDQGPDCYDITRMNVVSHNGAAFTVAEASEPDFQLVLNIVRSGDKITVTAFGETDTMFKSTRKVSSFTPECVGKGNADKWIR